MKKSQFESLIREVIRETIRKVDGKYVVYPEKGGKRLGTHSTKSAAEKQLTAIHLNKEIVSPPDGTYRDTWLFSQMQKGNKDVLFLVTSHPGIDSTDEREIFKQAKKLGYGALKVDHKEGGEAYVIHVNTPRAKAKAERLLKIANSHGGYLADKTPEEAREIGKLLDYDPKDTERFIARVYGDRDIKKESIEIKYTNPNFDAEWEEAVRYPEFNNMGKEQWIRKARVGGPIQYSKIKNVLGNVDLDFESLEEPKKQRFQAAFQKGVIEMPIAVKFSNDDYDLVAGNTRLSGLVKNGIDAKIWIVDLSDMHENYADTTLDERTINENAAISFLINIIIRLGGAALYYFSDYIIDSLSRLIKPGNTIILLKRLKKNKQFYKELGELIKKDRTGIYDDFSEKLLSLPSAKKELEKLVKEKNLSVIGVNNIKTDIQHRFRRSFLEAAEAIERQFPQGDQEVEENYADGKVKGKSRPGRVKKAGASCKGSVTDLRAKAKKYGGEKGKMYHWCANMKGGKK